MIKSTELHPCLSCGACCAFFKVSFHWSETLAVSHHVPVHLTEMATSHRLSMLGTSQVKPRCTALSGQVSEDVSCDIYKERPSGCRDFKASFEDGKSHDKCDQARIGHNLLPLTLESWLYKLNLNFLSLHPKPILV